LVIVESEKGPKDSIGEADFTKPHIVSRLLSGEVLKINNPQEEELRTILIALLEKHHLRLKDSQLDLILARVPAIPEYFRVVSEALTELVPRSGKLRISALKNFLDVPVF
jgi:chromosomal replication initiation ATPase DnaA